MIGGIFFIEMIRKADRVQDLVYEIKMAGKNGRLVGGDDSIGIVLPQPCNILFYQWSRHSACILLTKRVN